MGSGKGKTRRAQTAVAAVAVEPTATVKEDTPKKAEVEIKNNYGSLVEFVDVGTGKTQAFKIVAHRDQDVQQGLLSVESPVGKALNEQEAGGQVEVSLPNGTKRSLKVTKITAG